MGTTEQIIILAHQTAAMRGQKKLQPLDHYLKAVRRQAGKKKPDQIDAVVALLERMAVKNGSPPLAMTDQSKPAPRKRRAKIKD